MKTYQVQVPVRALATVSIEVQGGESEKTVDIIERAIANVSLQDIEQFEGVKILPTNLQPYWFRATIISK